MNETLAISPDAWPWLPDRCPADLHFTEWFFEQDFKKSMVLHIGTGRHHYVGQFIHLNNGIYKKNSCLGITNSVEEMQAYMDLAIANPQLSKTYKVLFTDAYLLNLKLLPRLDIVTMFHLGEIQKNYSDAYTNYELVHELAYQMKPRGRILFYKDSFTFRDITETVISQMCSANYFKPIEEYKTLQIYGSYH